MQKITSQRKAISPIIATLLLVLIAIAAGVVVYAYVLGFIGNSTTNSGGSQSALSVDQLALTSKTSTYPVVAFIRNLGPSSDSFNSGFFVKSSTLNDQLAPAISLYASIASNLKTMLITQTGVGVITVAIECSVAATVTVSMFGVSGALTIACPTVSSASTTITVSTLTFSNSPSNGNLVDFTSTGLALSTSSAAPTFLAVNLATGASINEAINQVGQFTLTVPTANLSVTASALSLSAGTTYTFQATGTDGATTTSSAKSS